MHFHDTLVAKLMDAYNTYGGFKDETRLRNVIKDMLVEVVKLQDGSLTVVYRGDVARGPR
jgi:hypothetical protein